MSDDEYSDESAASNEYPVGGCLISDEPSDLPRFGAMRAVSDRKLPSAVDLRQLMTPVEQQEQINSW